MNENEHRYDRHGVVADIQRVMEYADALGLHGVMILAPVCTTCGMLHQWNMLSDMMDGPNGSDAPVRGVLKHHLDKLDRQAPVALEPTAKGREQ